MLETINIKVLTFDCYGTLIDWDSGVNIFFKGILPDKDQKFIKNIIKRWETIQFQLIQEKYLPYEELQKRSFTQAFREYSIITQPNVGKRLLEKIPFWNPFPDVYQVLTQFQLKNHYKLVLISNGPSAILKENARNMKIKFDEIISAESIGAYKPSLNVFRYALKQLHIPTSEILHIAAGYKYDIIPAKTLGIKTVWVNRKKITQPGKISPNYEVTNLSSLSKIVIL